MKFLNIFKQKHELFEEISGYDNIKEIANNAIDAPTTECIHLLLEGDPGLGKTEFLRSIRKKYPEISYLAIGSGTTWAGIVQKCFEMKPRYLLIDEIEHLSPSAQHALLTLLQDGILVETKKSSTREISFPVTVFATCNSIKKIQEPLLTRFIHIKMKPYTNEEFRKVAQEQLRDKCSNAMADFIVEKIITRSNRNIRDCIKIAALCRNETQVLKYLETVK